MRSPRPRPGLAAIALVLVGCRFEIPASGAGADNPVDLPAPADLGTPPPPDLLPPPPPSPDRDGPRPVASFDLTVRFSGLFNDTTISVYGPGAGATLEAGPFPLVILSPAVFVGRGEYAQYARRLASHGFLAVAQSPPNEIDPNAYRDNLGKLLGWLLAPTGSDAPKVVGRADPERVGLLGHGRGGKISLLVASGEPRVKALLALDPVDTTESVTARGVVGSLRLGGAPLAFLGETVSRGSGITCPQENEDYTELYRIAAPPALSVTFTAAGHHEFLDDRARCGDPCRACRAGTAPPAETHRLAVKYTAAYFLWTLAGAAWAQPYLLGAEFDRDAMTGAVSRTSK